MSLTAAEALTPVLPVNVPKTNIPKFANYSAGWNVCRVALMFCFDSRLLGSMAPQWRPATTYVLGSLKGVD